LYKSASTAEKTNFIFGTLKKEVDSSEHQALTYSNTKCYVLGDWKV